MADNRLWLVHRPSGEKIMLGKRMAWGWHNAPEASQMEDFFEAAADTYMGGDDFFLAMEDASAAPAATSEWDFCDDRLIKSREYDVLPVTATR